MSQNVVMSISKKLRLWTNFHETLQIDTSYKTWHTCKIWAKLRVGFLRYSVTGHRRDTIFLLLGCILIRYYFWNSLMFSYILISQVLEQIETKLKNICKVECSRKFFNKVPNRSKVLLHTKNAQINSLE